MKRILTLALAAVLLFALCPAGPRAAAATPAKLPVEGEYTLFMMEIKTKPLDPAKLGLDGKMILLKDGTGTMTMFGEEGKLSKWTEKDGVLTVWDDTDTKQETLLQDGIVEMEILPGYYLYFAQKGVDTKDFVTSGHPTDSKLYAFYKGLDVEKGVHLRYQYHSDYMDSTSAFDTHAKGENFISQRTTRVKNYESPTVTLYTDGTVYLLDREKKTATTVMSVPLIQLGGDVLMLDELCKVIAECFMRTDYTVEERELDKESFTVEVFPATDSAEEAAFYYDKDGQLVHVLVAAPRLMPDLGETFYTVEVPDDKVDETLFDLKGYTIEKT